MIKKIIFNLCDLWQNNDKVLEGISAVCDKKTVQKINSYY